MLAISTRVHAQATQDIIITASVPKSCTINGAANGTVDNVVLTITGGLVDDAPFSPPGSPYLNVNCNTPADLRLTSVNGAVKNIASSIGGHTNVINYQAAATWNGVTASLDTEADASANGPESGIAKAVGPATGSLTVTITPIKNTAPLLAGAYTDTLRVTLTPQ